MYLHRYRFTSLFLGALMLTLHDEVTDNPTTTTLKPSFNGKSHYISLASTLESNIQNCYVAIRNLAFLVTEVSRPKDLEFAMHLFKRCHVEQVRGGGEGEV